ncbi:MAG: hypothetical protein GC185_04485 [Alphaproteobacteria bacterium]|nr:hypothetical protein [Alphaproteobacteria bacterium]
MKKNKPEQQDKTGKPLSPAPAVAGLEAPVADVPPANDNKDETPAPKKSWREIFSWKNVKASIARKARTVKTYAVEIFNEHDLWVEALAVKGGASAVVAAGIVGLSYVVALPFMVAAGGIALCGALIGLGAYGMAAGGARAWDSLKATIARIRGVEPEHHEFPKKRDIFQRLQNTKLIRKIRDSKIAKTITATRAWKVTEKFMRQSEETILGGLALGGAVATLAVGGALLATQVLVLPVVAIGATATFAAVEAVTMIASGAYGLYLCYDNYKHRRAEKQAARLARQTQEKAAETRAQLGAEAALQNALQDKKQDKKPGGKKPLSDSFAREAANTDASPVKPEDPAQKAQPASVRPEPKKKAPPGR